MTDLSRLRRGLQNPAIIKRKLGILAVRPFTKPTGDGISFVDRDWDVLVVLDACRYDLFEEYNPFDVSVEKVHSNASQTREYIRENFVGRDCLDTVCITASPQFADFDIDFAHTEHVWRDQWNTEFRTVLPESVTDAAIEAADEYPDKRLVVHFMQPHYPFIGPTGQTLDDQATFGSDVERLSIWEQLSDGRIEEATVRKAYAENLELVLPEVKRLVENVNGKTVITSDHGNLYGQRVCWLPIKIYGHPAGIYHPELTAVPWVELPFETRRPVVSAASSSVNNEEFEGVEERLNDLGYR
jgi:hypothetical protein